MSKPMNPTPSAVAASQQRHGSSDRADAMIPLARPVVGAAEQAAVFAVLSSGRLARGEVADSFESEFSTRVVSGRPCVALSSGTSALVALLLAHGIGPGDEVIVPGFTFAATANCVLAVGAEPVLCDIDADTYCINPKAAAALVGPRTTAIVAVHLYGHPAAMDELHGVCADAGLLLLEDAAHAPGASLGGAAAGALGDGAAFSFYATKNMTTGEGGMAVLTDHTTAAAVKQVANQGMSAPYVFERFGLNFRMSEIAAAIGLEQLKQLEAFNTARQTNAAVYDTALGAGAPKVRPGAVHVYHQYTIRAHNRQTLVDTMSHAGIQCRVHYPQALDELDHLAHAASGDLPQCRLAARQTVSVPVGPHLRHSEITHIATALASVAADCIT